MEAVAGTAAVPIISYFDGFGSPKLPAGFSSSCTGLCGSSGWRARSHYIDSGFHGDNDVESVLRLSKTFVQDGFISFKYSVDSVDGGLEFFIDGVRQQIFRPEDGSHGRRFASDTVRFRVAKGSRSFIWLYDQAEGSQGRVVVEALLLQGVEGGGSQMIPCPPGTYAVDKGSVECIPCARGYYASEAGSQSCSPCEIDHFQSLTGQSGCSLCPAGSSAPQLGSSFCSYGCTYSGPSYSWDLRLISDTLIRVDAPLVSRLFYLQLCQPIQAASVCNDTSGALVQSHVCEVDPVTGHATSAGSSVVFGTTPDNQQLQLTFSGGADCDTSGTAGVRESTLIIECSPEATRVETELVFADGCRRIFRMRAIYGCRGCSSSFGAGSSNPDYSLVVSECVNNLKNLTYLRTSRCAGPMKHVESVACTSSEVDVPYYGVAIVFGILVVLLAGVLFLVFRNRKISRSYTQLLEQRESNVPMGTLSTNSGTSMMDSSVDLENQETL